MGSRFIVIASVVGALMAAGATASAQSQSGWLPCAGCLTEEAASKGRDTMADVPFNPRDISGVWGPFPREQLSTPPPPMTPLGQELYQATRAEDAPDELTSLSNSNDGMLICDPLGWPRYFTYNYGFEFVQLPDRVFQFFELGHTWRTIWTDGRTLPDPEEVEPRWLGYAVGRWEGDTFVIESNGFDERAWLSENRQDRRWGYPQSGHGLRVEERYRRVAYHHSEAILTIIDPEIYTEPWVTTGDIFLNPWGEIGEFMCVPSDHINHVERVLRPAAGAGD